MNLENIFNEAASKQDKEREQYILGLKKLWDKYRTGAVKIHKQLSFLKDKGYNLKMYNDCDFIEKEARESSYPAVRIDNAMITIRYVDEDTILISGLGKFSLMGERHSYESFLKKLV